MQFRPKGALKILQTRNVLCGSCGGIGGGSGPPSATSVPGFTDRDCGGIGGGSGPPSATSVPAFTDGGSGASRGGNGAPSAYSVRSILTRSPAETLTNRTTGSTIKTANTETATASIIFFKGGTLLGPA